MRWLVAIGLLVGLFANFAAVALAGAGHGWCSPLSVSWIAVITGPLAGVAWARGNRLLALTLLVFLLAADCLLVTMTFREGTRYFLKSWNHGDVTVVVWAGAWLYGQVFAVAALIAPYRPR